MKKFIPILFASWYFIMYDVTGGPLVTYNSPIYDTQHHCEQARSLLYDNVEIPGARLYKTTPCKSLRESKKKHTILQDLDKYINEWYK